VKIRVEEYGFRDARGHLRPSRWRITAYTDPIHPRHEHEYTPLFDGSLDMVCACGQTRRRDM
jgi:hypothetical protein